MFGLSLFAVPGGADSRVKVARIEDKMGLHGSPTCELHFDDAPAYLVGKRKFGLFHVVDILNHARFSVAAQAIGIAEAAYQAARDYARERMAFGQLIGDMPIVHNMLEEMRLQLQACRAMVYAGSQVLDLRNKLDEHIEAVKAGGDKPAKEDVIELKRMQKKLDLLSPLVKYIATEAANRICYDAQQVFGGHGFIRGATVERCIRDVRITTIYEGTTQIQVGLASKHMLADVLGEYFDGVLSTAVPQSLATCQCNLVALRELWRSSVAAWRELDDYSQGVAMRQLTDMYGALYAGCLLLEGASDDEARAADACRYAAQARAEAVAGHARVTGAYYAAAAATAD